ncbi:GNAT family N-acetyltransferase [Nonomuraea thailandensis]
MVGAPEQLDAYPDRLAEALERPDFNAWVERDHEGRLIGICYGWPTPADLSGSRIYDMLRDSFGAPAVSRMTAGSFEVVELFVHPEARGKGIASRLLAQATAGWPKAWLITSPQAPAARLYHRLGWQEAGPLPGDPRSRCSRSKVISGCRRSTRFCLQMITARAVEPRW